MAELLKYDNFKGMVADSPDGKQPPETCKEIKNLVYDRETGSLVTRFTYEASLARPTGVSTLDAWLTFPTTYPSTQDNHIWFTEDGIFVRPYWHNSATATDDWKLITESVTVTGGSITVNPTVTGTPTNTIVMGNNIGDLGLDGVDNYYKNWVLRYTDDDVVISLWQVTAYSVTAQIPTFTLEQIIDVDTGVTVTGADLNANGFILYRFFHKDRISRSSSLFTPAYTTPAGYADETGYRWSGGGGSTTGYKNLKHKYLSKIFFSGSTKPYTFTGSYIDQAECFAPAAGLLTSSSFTTSDANANKIENASDYDFNGLTTNWTAAGNHAAFQGRYPTIGNDRTIVWSSLGVLVIGSNGADGDFAVNGTNNAILTTSYTAALTSGTEYTVKIRGRAIQQYGLQTGSIKARVQLSGGTNHDSPELFFVQWSNGTGGLPGIDIASEVQFTFTPAASQDFHLMIMLPNVSKGLSNQVQIDAITVTETSSAVLQIESNKTYKLWASYVYDKTQESEYIYLSSKFVTGKFSKLSYEVNQTFATLNKFVTAIRLYMSQEDGDQTSSTTTTVAPKYLMATIPIDNDATSTWTFDTAAGRYEYASSFNGIDWINRGRTWEQNTKRTVSNSTTCSYSLAIQASGRIFLSSEYDYYDARVYTNRLRYNGFNYDGVPTPDIFPNINDVFITTVTVGSSQEIRNIVEYEGDVIILKKSSILRLDTSNPNPFTWELLLIKNGVGTRSSNSALKFEKGLIFSDLYSMYLYDGYRVTDVIKGVWRNLYQSIVTTDTIGISQEMWYNPVNDTISIAYDTVTSNSTWSKYYEFNTNTWLPTWARHDPTTISFANVATTSDGIVHFAPVAVGANAYKIATAVGTPLVDISLDTGYHDVQKGMVGIPKWLYFLAESPISTSTIVVSMLCMQPDGTETTVISSATFTPTTTNKFLYKVQTSQDIRATMIKVTMLQIGVVAPSTKQFKLHKLWVEGDLVPEHSDVTLLPA